MGPRGGRQGVDYFRLPPLELVHLEGPLPARSGRGRSAPYAFFASSELRAEAAPSPLHAEQRIIPETRFP